MMSKQQMLGRAFQSAVLMAALCLTTPVLAECIPSDPPADTILAIDANNGCADIQDQAGCTISKWDKSGYGECTDAFDRFKVISIRDDETGGVSWHLENNTISGIDTAIFGGGNQGKNNCGYIYNSDVDKGIGGDCTSGDLNNCTNFQNITRLDICTDGIDDVAPTPPEVAYPLPSCSATGYRLDDTGIECPTYSAQEESDAQGAYDLCILNNSDDTSVCKEPTIEEGQEKPVVVCNLEKDKEDWGTTDGTDVCCQCGIPEASQTACVVTEDRSECTQSMTVNPTQSVELMFFKDDVDPCTWIKTSKGWKQWCY